MKINWAEEVSKSFLELANNEELAYLCVTAKPESAIRDKLTWVLQKRHPELFVSREYTTKVNGQSKRLDFAIYSKDKNVPLVAFEAKAMLVRDLFWGLEEHKNGKSLHPTFKGISDDILNAVSACPQGSEALGLLFLWQIYSDIKPPDEISTMRSYLKYAGEHAESVRRKEHENYYSDLENALTIANLDALMKETIGMKGPHQLHVAVTMLVLKIK